MQPSLEEFEQVVRLSKVDEPESHHPQHSSTLMRPPPHPPRRPSNSRPARPTVSFCAFCDFCRVRADLLRSQFTASRQFQAQARRSTDESSDEPRPVVYEGQASLFHHGRVVAVDHWGPSMTGFTQATRYPSRGTRENPLNID